VNIVLKLRPAFAEFAGKQEKIEVSGSTIKEALDDLFKIYPVFKDLLFDQEHILSALIIYRGEVVVQNRLDRKVEDHQEILILPMVQGG
jgi:molybdopterin converting factor small subunit